MTMWVEQGTRVCLRLQAAEEGAGRLGQELRQVFRRPDQEPGSGLRQRENGPADEGDLWQQRRLLPVRGAV